MLAPREGGVHDARETQSGKVLSPIVSQLDSARSATWRGGVCARVPGGGRITVSEEEGRKWCVGGA